MNIGPSTTVMPLEPAMHIPDGFISPAVSALLWLLALAGVGYALWRVNREMDERRMPLMGVLAAAIFAGQMLNFAVVGGTSGHLMGAALATILLGPWASIVIMTAVLSIQALLFQDGGLLALGANILNMAIVGSLVSYAVHAIMRRVVGTRRWGALASGFVSGWCSVVAAALLVGLQLALSGTSPASVALPAMGGIHALIGLGEGLITAGALAFIAAARPDLLGAGAARAGSNRGVVLVGLAVAVLLAIISPLASSNPDGLERVAEELSFLDAAQGPSYEIMPDYAFPGISNGATATIVAGVLGALIVAGVAWFSGRLGRRKDVAG